MSTARLGELIAQYGSNTNHYFATYPGFQFFEGESGAVAYVEKRHAWVAAGEPLAPADKQVAAWREFTEAARKQGKGAVCIPVGDEFVNACVAQGFGALMIGSEPTFRLETYPRSGQTWLSVVATAKQLHNKGARVREVPRAELEGEKRAELDAITAEWLSSRKMDELGFLNKVEPFRGLADKRYFEITSGAKATAFVAAIPVAARGGWYLVDVMRRSDTEPGTTELLLLETMRLLKDSGAREVTLGVAPLAGLEAAPERQRASRLHSVLSWVYEKGDLFYNFRSLNQFKQKFEPTAVRPAYVVFEGESLRPLVAVSLLEAFAGRSLVRAGVSGLWRGVAHFELQRWIKAQVAPTVVVRSAPPGLFRLLYRLRATSSLVLLMIALALGSFTGLKIDPELASRWAYSFDALRAQAPHSLVLSMFLHWNLAHLASNVMMAVVFCGLLEYLGGTLLTLTSFFAGALLANPLASLVYVFGLSAATSEPDLGSSLGILACAGAACTALKRGPWLAALLALGSIAAALATHSTLGLNHLIALALGAAVAAVYLRS